MGFNFAIKLPGAQPFTQSVSTKPAADELERDLVAQRADYMVRAPKWIGGSFRITPEARDMWDRLVARQKSRTDLSDDLGEGIVQGSRGGLSVERNPVAHSQHKAFPSHDYLTDQPSL